MQHKLFKKEMQHKLLKKKIRAIVNKLGVDTVKYAALSLKKYAALYPKMRGPAKYTWI